MVFTRLTLGLALAVSLFITSDAQTTSAPAAPAPPAATQKPPGLDAPSAFYGIASAVNKDYIYYQGGQLNANTTVYTDSLYALSLTTQWPKTDPAWVNLSRPKGITGPKVGFHSATMSKDGKTLFITAPVNDAGKTPFLYQYDIGLTAWSTVPAPEAQAADWGSKTWTYFVTDDTDALWLVGGSVPNKSTNEVDKFLKGAWSSYQATSAAGSSKSSLSEFSYGSAHIYDKKVYIFGGFSSTIGQRGYQSFQLLPWIDISGATPTFGEQLTMGSFPSARQEHCSVLTDSGKILVYGGFDGNSKEVFDDIWSLDLITWSWSRIIPKNAGTKRFGHSCHIAGANMIVYGGKTFNAAFSGDVQVYDVTQASWMDSYVPKQDNTPRTQPLPGSQPSNGLSVGAIVGIVAGVIILLALIVGLFLYKRRQKQIEIQEAEMEKEAYLASLRPEVGNDARSKPRYSPRSPNAIRAGATPMVSTPGAIHNGVYNVDEVLLNSAAASPGIGGQAQPNVQYLMQHLPDGTIAVQPVYLDHQPMAMQTSPNMMAASPDLSGGGYVSPRMAGHPGGVYVAPPPTAMGSGIASPGLAATSPYVLPPSARNAPGQDPFASPTVSAAPLPPGYNPADATSDPTSPQQGYGQLR
ncbi:MAG: hypothetical protein J3Q66DRAFT_23603 [Benniella sp.]|nr:MAG: hypothetical protein J3Q66DRAFT_23603 [Benniella sp.]